LFPKLTDIAVTTVQQVTGEDFEDQCSDDGSGSWSVYGEMLENHVLDEQENHIAAKLFEHCSILEKLSLVRNGWVTPWYPIRGSQGVLESVYTPPLNFEAWSETRDLRMRTHDPEGFPKLFAFPRQTRVCNEAWDPPVFGCQSREASSYRVN